MSDTLSYLMEHGMSSEDIQKSLDKGLTLEELEAAVSQMEERGESIDGEMDPAKLLEPLQEAKSPRELLTEAVKDAYRAETPEQRALLYCDLREIAKAGHFTKEFDTAFSAFSSSVEAEERPAAPKQTRERSEKQAVSIETVTDALHSLGISVRFNQLLKEIEVKGLPPCYSEENAVNVLPVYLCDYLKACDYSGASVLAVEGYLNCIADKNRYNPIREYLLAGQWDGADRFQEIYRILGVTLPRYQMYIRKWFIQCVALGLNDDDRRYIGAEGALVLQGEQGLAKTSFFRMMSPFPRWFVEGAIIDMRDKDSQIKALRGWICELGELDGTIKKEQSALKAFITSPEDRIRMPYGRSETRSPRRTSFCGTVNPREYLKDETGSRRFWTVPLTSVDKQVLFSLPREWVDQVWYQSYQMYLENPNGFRMTDAEIQALQMYNKHFEQPLPYELEIMEQLDYGMPPAQWEWWSAAEVAKYMPGVADAKKVGKALTKIATDNTPSFVLQSFKATKPVKQFGGISKYLVPLRQFNSENVKASWAK